MADLTITAANVVSGGGTSSRIAHGTAGATLTAGQVVYYDTTTSTYKLADNNSGTAAVRSPAGIVLNAAATGQPVSIHTSGSITIGATLTGGVAYYLSDTPGGICPVADLVTGEYPTFLGIATSAALLQVAIVESGFALA
jgi:hypothetical protein